MSDTVTQARDHYRADGLLERVKGAIAALGPASDLLTVEQLAPMDQFHTRGLLATLDLAHAAQVTAGMRVLDLGSGVGGPARVLAARFGADVTGVDLSASFVETAAWLSARCGLEERTRFLVGDAIAPPVEPDFFDLVLLQHVAMNIGDRDALYRAARRALKPSATFVTYDIVAREQDPIYPTPWARTASASFLLTKEETVAALERAGLAVQGASDDTEIALSWFAEMQAKGPPVGPGLGVVLGPDTPVLTGTLARNLREGRIGVATIVAKVSGQAGD